MSRLFPARHDGECDVCGWDVDAGELVGYTDADQLVCAECWTRWAESLR